MFFHTAALLSIKSNFSYEIGSDYPGPPIVPHAMVVVAYPEPSQRGMQEMSAHAAREGVRTQVDIPTSPQELFEYANKNCDSKLKESALLILSIFLA